MSLLLVALVLVLTALIGVVVGFLAWRGPEDFTDAEVAQNWMEANRDEHL